MGKLKMGSPYHYGTDSGAVFLVGDRDVHNPQERHNRSCNGPMQFYWVGKKPSMKADLTIYSLVVDVSGQDMSVSLILGNWISVLVPFGMVFVNPVTYNMHSYSHMFYLMCYTSTI